MSKRKREPGAVAVIGAGVSGLTVAYELLQRAKTKLRIVCLDSSTSVGGNIATDLAEGFLCEWGPNGFLDNVPATLDLVHRLGLSERVVHAEQAAERRFIFRGGRLREVPLGPLSFLASSILPPLGKLRLLMEPIGRGAPDGIDESVFGFASRRIGPAAARVLVDAMVSGVYAGDVRQLSLRSTFPKMFAMEQEHGSLFRAMIARRKRARIEGREAGGPAGPGGRLTSFREGMRELPDALHAALGKRVELGRAVTGLSDMGQGGFRVHFDQGASIETDAVVLACPAFVASRIVAEMDPAMSKAMDAIPSAPLAVVHFGFKADALAARPAGFGYLVPRGQGPRILGTLWSSEIFVGRAPQHCRLLTNMIGGAHDPTAVELDDAALIEAVRGDLARTMEIQVAPFFTRIFRHPRGIPQYTIGHAERLATIEQRLESHPGAWVSGNSYRGISVNSCVEEAPGIADRVLAHLERRGS